MKKELIDLLLDTSRNLEDIIELVKSSDFDHKDSYLKLLEENLLDVNFVKNHIELNKTMESTDKKENYI